MEEERSSDPVWVVRDSVLSLVAVTNYEKLWDDKKTGCPHGDVSFHRPLPPEGFSIFGDLAIPSQNWKNVADVTCYAVREEKIKGADSSDIPALCPPLHYKMLWSSKGSSAAFGKCAIWEILAPAEYVALGYIVTPNFEFPKDIPVVCVHKSMCIKGEALFEKNGVCIWSDMDSHASLSDVSIWRVGASKTEGNRDVGVELGTFICNRIYTKPEGDLYCLNANKVVGYDPPKQTQQQPSLPYPKSLTPTEQPVPIYQTDHMGASLQMAPFCITSRDAESIFNAWKKDTWFASAAAVSSWQPCFLPFFIYDTVISTTSATKAFQQTSTRSYHSEPYLATRDAGIPQDVVSKLNTWDLRSVKTASTDISAVKEPNLESKAVWEVYVQKDLIKKEMDYSEAEFRKDNKHTEGLNTETNVDDVQCHTVYLPVIIGRYRVKGETFSFVINGQTGEIDGQYPILKGGTPPALMSQESLSKEDNNDCYILGATYLILPKPSKTRGGWVELRNKSQDTSLELISQRRTRGRKLAHFELKPGTTEFIQYHGNCCIAIVSGSTSHLQVTGFGNGSVSGKEGNRLLLK